MRSILTLVALPAAFALAACQTSFQGDPHFPGGVGGCAATCQQAGLEMSGFIYSGEFSSACVCRPPRAPAPTYAPPAAPAGPAASAPVSYADDDPVMDDAAAVGVIMQMREQQQRQASAQPHHY